MVFRFLHLADLHLDSHFGGRPAARERLREGALEAFGRAVDHALEQRLHAVLLAGDLFDDELLSVHVELFLVNAVRRLAQGGVHVLIAAGNHDPGAEGFALARSGLGAGSASGSPSGSEPAEAGEAWRERVHVFRSATPEVVQIDDAEGAPVGVVVGAGHEGAREGRNLASRFRRLDTSLPVVGLLHTQVDTAHGAERHARYAPSTREDFEHLRYAYWALGHVHLRQQPFEGLPVWYSGNLIGRSMRETGPKGGLEVEAHPGAFAEPRFVPFAPVRHETLELSDLAPFDNHDALARHLAGAAALEAQAGDEALCLRFALSGPTPLVGSLRDATSRAMLEEELMRSTRALDIVIEDRGLHRPRDLDELRAVPSILGRALDLLDSARGDDALLERLAPRELAGREAAGMGRGAPQEGEARRAYLRSLLEGLEHELVERCLREDPA